jgi:hypothetical protein
MSKKYSKEEVEKARTRLLELLKPGDKVYCILRHVSRSGMLQLISPVVFEKNEPGESGYPFHLDNPVAAVLGWPSKGTGEGIRVNGCGMDMGFHLVYSLSWVLFKDGYALKHEWI